LYKDAKDDNIVGYEFILQQLLFASTMLDLSDEVGRRYLFEQLKITLMSNHASSDQLVASRLPLSFVFR